jgi:hypothetical protein
VASLQAGRGRDWARRRSASQHLGYVCSYKPVHQLVGIRKRLRPPRAEVSSAAALLGCVKDRQLKLTACRSDTGSDIEGVMPLDNRRVDSGPGGNVHTAATRWVWCENPHNR